MIKYKLMLTAETQMALGKIRGVARIFSEVRTFFSNYQLKLSTPQYVCNLF